MKTTSIILLLLVLVSFLHECSCSTNLSYDIENMQPNEQCDYLREWLFDEQRRECWDWDR